MRHSWRSKDELKSDFLLWTPTHGLASVGRLARTYIQQLCGDTGSNLEDLPGMMHYRDGWRELGISVLAARPDNDDDDDDEISVCVSVCPPSTIDNKTVFNFSACIYKLIVFIRAIMMTKLITDF